MTARRVERLEQIKKELLEQYKNIQVYTASMDMTDKNQIKDVVDNLPASFKDVDVLVNNAGNIEFYIIINPFDNRHLYIISFLIILLLLLLYIF